MGQLSYCHRIWCASILVTLVILVLTSVVLPIQGSEATSSSHTSCKVGFIMVGPISDLGWNYAHEQGRLYVQSALGKNVETTVAENVPANAEAERVMEKLIASGNKLIFTTSYGLLEPALRVAKRYPEITFMHMARPNLNPIKNLGTAVCYLHEPVYVAGIVAGHMTKTNKIGFVAAHPVPQVLQNINALTLGARSANPKATVRVVWTNNWSDPPTEAEAAKGLIDTGIDVGTSSGPVSEKSSLVKQALKYHQKWCHRTLGPFVVASLFLITLLAPQSMCANTKAAATTTPLKIGFIMVGPVSDWGWNYQHNQGRLFLEKAMPG